MKAIRLCLLLGALQLLLILVSWLVTAAVPDVPMRSLLSPEGIRWFFGRFVQNMAHPLLVWLVLFYIAFNAYRRGGLQHALSTLLKGERLMLRQRSALWLVLLVVLVMVVVVLLLVFSPSPLLASVTGALYPSSFSSALVPMLAFILFTASVVYAMSTGQVRKYRLPYQGRFSLLLLVYVLAMQLWRSLCFVFG